MFQDTVGFVNGILSLCCHHHHQSSGVYQVFTVAGYFTQCQKSTETQALMLVGNCKTECEVYQFVTVLTYSVFIN